MGKKDDPHDVPPPNTPEDQPAVPPTNDEAEDVWLELEPPPAKYGYFWQPSGVERLKEVYGLQTASELHPSLALIDRHVSQQLRRAYEVFTSKGFKVDPDPVNYSGDGKSWALVCEPTDKLPQRANPLEVATQCQSECIKGAQRPFWQAPRIVVPLWVSATSQAMPSQSIGTPAPIQNERAQQGRGRPKSRLTQTRRLKIREVARTGVTGERYCAALDAKGFPTHPEWQLREHCPKTYIEAWNHPDPNIRKRWHKRISDEKNKAVNSTRQ